MKPGRILIQIAMIALSMVPLAVTSNSPRLTWYRFKVHGRVTRPSGSLDNYTVTLVTRSHGEWSSFHSPCAEYMSTSQPVSLTNENGGFALIVVSCGFEFEGGVGNDTLAVAVILPDTTLIGAPFRVGGVSPSVTSGTCSSGGIGCAENEYDCVYGYTYDYPAKNIPIP